MSRILVIDDSEITLSIMEAMITGMGHEMRGATTLAEGMALAAGAPGWDLVLLDVVLPDGNGIRQVPRLKSLPNAPEIIIITAQGDPDGASLAIQEGVWDYLEKGASSDRLRLSVNRALEYRARKARQSSGALPVGGIVGTSAQLQANLELLAVAAHSDANVLITGETGTGKELFARALHQGSKRSQGPFVVVDCASLPRELADSILFGHVKGAFTSADKSHEGLVAQANGGTLFLDELGELPLAQQKNFLRVLQEGVYRQVGGGGELRSDFRVVAATNRDIADMVEQGTFRNDLLYRLNVFALHIPPLRARLGDVPVLARHFLDVFAAKYQTGPKETARDFMEVLEAYSWPGNVRELMNTMEKAVVLARNQEKLYAAHLPTHIRQHHALSMLRQAGSEGGSGAGSGGGREARVAAQELLAQELALPGLPPWKTRREAVIKEAAREYFLELMRSVQGDMHRASEISDMSVPNLYASLRKYGVSAKRMVYGG